MPLHGCAVSLGTSEPPFSRAGSRQSWGGCGSALSTAQHNPPVSASQSITGLGVPPRPAIIQFYRASGCCVSVCREEGPTAPQGTANRDLQQRPPSRKPSLPGLWGSKARANIDTPHREPKQAGARRFLPRQLQGKSSKGIGKENVMEVVFQNKCING